MNLENLSKPELLMFFSVLEGELEARDVVIEALQAQHRDRFIQERYGKYDISDPFLALQRDCESIRDGNHGDNQPVCTNPLSVLKVVMTQCKTMQERMVSQLAAAESRHRKVILDLEEERRRHAQDTAEGDDVTYMLEKERERLTQQFFEQYLNCCVVSDLYNTRRRRASHQEHWFKMGNVFQTFVDTDTGNYLSEIIGIDLDPGELENLNIHPDGTGHHHRCTIPLIVDAKRLLRADKKYFTASGNSAKIHKMATTRGPRATMPINQGVFANKSHATKTGKYPFEFTPSNNNLHLSHTFNIVKHPKVLHRGFFRKDLPRRLWKIVTKNLESGIAGNPAAIASHNPGTTIARNTDKMSRPTLVTKSSVIPTRGTWLTAPKRSGKSTSTPLVTVMKIPRSNITERPSATISQNPWATLMSTTTSSQNPLMTITRSSRVTPPKKSLTLRSRNPNIVAIRSSSATTVRSQSRMGIRKPTNIIKIPHPATDQNPNKIAIQKPNGRAGQNSNRITIQKPNRIAALYPNRIATRKPNRIACQNSNKTDVEDVNHITIEKANKVVIQNPKIPTITKGDKGIIQNPNIITIGNANIIHIS
ncbi:CTTNBP2 N-terminal like b isoform X2 [Scyliorhinus canicula]|uniref:CTTNBP2 N-terminal like b isoform X2 n=1 Tax=Scyliorhinus canicula TaxID=7830 RepID=UPI0018F4740C|nr:CTTNBP2 N-terminal like b isoform X2 [Scyliorhinus canicula]